MEKIAGALDRMRDRGVILWIDKGELRYKAPRGSLAPEDIAALRESKDQIIAFLSGTPDLEDAASKVEDRRILSRAPLTFSQLAHWHLNQLGERQSIRQIASATRLHGELNVGALRQSVACIVRRHWALRTRIVIVDGTPLQEVSNSGAPDLVVNDLTGFPQGLLNLAVASLIEGSILEPTDVIAGPLFGIRLAKLREDEHVLIVAMEHIISDEFSINLLLRDLFDAYIQLIQGRIPDLPTISVQLVDYALWQRRSLPSWIAKHDTYWNEHAKGSRRVRFPVDATVTDPARPGWGTVPVCLDRDMRSQMLEWSRRRGTTLVMSCLTAYVGLIARWCDVSEVIVRYEIDGRVNHNVANTIGYFATALYPHVTLFAADTCLDLLNRVTSAYCEADEHADYGYLEARTPRPEFAHNPGFNWIPPSTALEVPSTNATAMPLQCSSVAFSHPMLKALVRDNEPVLLMVDNGQEIAGGVHFPLSRFSIPVMERFGRNLLLFIESFLKRPNQRVTDIVLQ